MNEEKLKIFKKLQVSSDEFKVNTFYWDHDVLTVEENSLRNYPAPWIKKTIDFLEIVDAKTIVEIGSTRFPLTDKCTEYYNNSYKTLSKDAPPCCQDGHSTFFWVNTGLETHTVDINPGCKTLLQNHYNNTIPSNLNIHTSDGIDFLKKFDKEIDFLFLDGWDKGTHEYAENHLRAFQASEDKLSENHIISIDDTDFVTDSAGKDKYLTPYLIDKGYFKLLCGRQIVFFKL